MVLKWRWTNLNEEYILGSSIKRRHVYKNKRKLPCDFHQIMLRFHFVNDKIAYNDTVSSLRD